MGIISTNSNLTAISPTPTKVVTIDILVTKLAKATHSKMTQYLFWATGYNVIGIPLAAGVAAPLGILLTPANAQAHLLRVVGAILMSVSTVVVSINAMLLRRIKLND